VTTGPHVTVNTILGLPFIQGTKMGIDAADHVAELWALDSSPFPIEYRRASVHVPVIDESALQVNHAQYNDVIQEVENLERYAGEEGAANASSPLSGSPCPFWSSHGEWLDSGLCRIDDWWYY
jgi:hypothetical protein